jgi:hypothetical protein
LTHAALAASIFAQATTGHLFLTFKPSNMRYPVEMLVDDILTSPFRQRLRLVYPSEPCPRRFSANHKEMLHLLSLRDIIAPQVDEIQFLNHHGSASLQLFLATTVDDTIDEVVTKFLKQESSLWSRAFWNRLKQTKFLYRNGYRLFAGSFVNFEGTFPTLFTETDRLNNIPTFDLYAIYSFPQYTDWLVKRVPRKTDPNHIDSYYYSPNSNYRLDSMINVDRFITLAATLWNEDPLAERNAMAVLHVLRFPK